MDAKHCADCYNDDYNHGLGGATECWHLKTAELVQLKRVHIDQRPPWNQPPETLPNCYTQTHFVFVKPDRIN